MKIQTVLISPPNHQKTELGAEVFRLKVSGPVDPNDAVMRRARELVLGTGSPAMIDSFDWAVRHGSFVTEE
jgi:hypothetical protein